jgi:hypothetical protein
MPLFFEKVCLLCAFEILELFGNFCFLTTSIVNLLNIIVHSASNSLSICSGDFPLLSSFTILFRSPIIPFFFFLCKADASLCRAYERRRSSSLNSGDTVIEL